MQTEVTAGLIAAVSTLGELERTAGDFAAALPYDLRAIELDPGNDSQVHVMANAYNNAGDADKAIEVYRAAVEAMPQNAFFDRSRSAGYWNRRDAWKKRWRPMSRLRPRIRIRNSTPVWWRLPAAGSTAEFKRIQIFRAPFRTHSRQFPHPFIESGQVVTDLPQNIP